MNLKVLNKTQRAKTVENVIYCWQFKN